MLVSSAAVAAVLVLAAALIGGTGLTVAAVSVVEAVGSGCAWVVNGRREGAGATEAEGTAEEGGEGDCTTATTASWLGTGWLGPEVPADAADGTDRSNG